MPVLYLLPNTLGDAAIDVSFTPQQLRIVPGLKHFIVENEKNARAFLKSCGVDPPYNDIRMYVVDKHTPMEDKLRILKEIGGADAGLLSDAGCPAVADPGAEMVRLAHGKGITVKPLVGPSSILLALMAGGFNGQGFSFHGYLPVKPAERARKLAELESQAAKDGYTQVFIETPYRNEQMLADIRSRCKSDTWLSVACDLTLPGEEIRTARIESWGSMNLELKGRPAVFSLWVEGAAPAASKKYGKKNRGNTRGHY